MDFQTKPLSVPLGSLKGLSERLVVSHHENNYSGAVKRLNAIRKQLGELDWAAAPVFVVNGLKREELVAANSAFLHELYFDALGGDGALPPSGLEVAMQRDFGAVDRWRVQFTALAKAMGGGSGWALLSWSSREWRLVNHWASDHTQMLAGATPLLALDMYEHAYHIDFGAKAAAYVDTFMQNIRWAAMHLRYRAAIAAETPDLGLPPGAVPGSASELIDVRHAKDFAAGADMIEGATWRDPACLADWCRQLDATKPVLVYCAKGLDIGRSAALALRAKGFEVRYLVGGIDAWRAAGQPLQAKTKLDPNESTKGAQA